MKLTLTRVQSRTLAISLALLALLAVVAAIAWPTLWLNRRYDAFLEDYGDRLQRYRRIVALRPAIEKAIGDTERLGSRKYYLKGPSPTLAAAELQGLVTRIIESQQGRVVSSQALTTKEDVKPGEPLKTAISVQLSASIIPLQMILHTLETTEPYVFIDQLTVRSNQSRQYKPVPGVQPEYVVQIALHAYVPAEEVKP